MIDALPLLLGPEGYQISRSVRLRSSASAYLSRTFGTPTNNKIWTYSVWMKRGSLSANRTIMSSNVDGAEYWDMRFNTSDQIFIQNRVGSSNLLFANTTAVYRDPSAWYHIVFVFDSDNATPANRNLLYVNNVNVSLSANSGSGNASAWNTSGVQHNIGVSRTLTTGGGIWAEFDGYETEVNFIDGQALTPSDFGETNPVTGVWQPKKYAGTYGTNGFYLNFSDNSAATAAAIGADYSGNGNNWTPNNISVTAGVTYDSMIDVPTLWADGGNGRGNYPVLNPLNRIYGNPSTSDGNLKGTSSSGDAFLAASMFCPLSGSWYAECTVTAKSGALTVEMRAASIGTAYSYNSDTGAITGTTAGATFTTNDVIGVAFDYSAQTIKFYKNGALQGTSPSITQTLQITFTNYIPNTSTAVAWNFGQRPFAYTPPTGFKALNTLNLPEPTILKGNQYFDATTYTGQNTSLSVTNSGSMQPDFVWIKKRNGATDHNLVDSVRGTDKNLISNSAAAESTVARLTSFDSGGFTLAGAFDNTNLSGSTYVGWQWKEGATQGFDIVTYTGTGVARTVAHSLGVAPSMMIVKNRTTAVAGAWPVYHQAIGATNYLFLDLTDAQSSVATPFNDTAPTSTVFSVDGGDRVNKSGNGIVAYLFAEVAGFSKFGSYTGNGSADGPFCFTGFLPRWVMIKRTDSTGDWYIWDTARNTSNLMTQVLFADLSAAESTYAAPNPVIDVLSNGFKQRGTYPHNNASGGTYIYMAFAEHPFKNALAR